MVIRYKKKSPKKIKIIMAGFLIMTIVLILAGSLFGLLFGANYIFDQSLKDQVVLRNPAGSFRTKETSPL